LLGVIGWSRKDPLDDFTIHIGEAEVAAGVIEGQSRVVEPK
jgi:hypothetical protein